MNNLQRIAGLALASLVPSSAALSQTITAAGGNATFTYNSGAVPTTGTAIGGGSSNLDVNGAATGGDQMFENWWWYRVDGVDTREFRYHAPTNPFVASGDTMNGTFNFANFRSDLTYRLTDPDGPGLAVMAYLTMMNVITNIGDVPLTLNTYSYADVDVNGALTNDYEYDPLSERFLCSSGGSTVYYQGRGANAFQAAPYTSTVGGPVRGLVADADIDNLNNTITGVPGDFTGAFQYIRTLQPGQSTHLVVTIGVNYYPIIPAPGSIVLHSLAAVVCIPRRQRVRSRLVPAVRLKLSTV